MKITSLKIQILKNTGNKMVGIVSITLENMIAIHDIKILKNAENLFLAMPSKPLKSGGFKDVVHPINALVRESIERIAFEAYNLCLSQNYHFAQFDAVQGSDGSLLEQTFEKFAIVSNKTDDPFNEDTVHSPQENKDPADNDKKSSNAFLTWLNN